VRAPSGFPTVAADALPWLDVDQMMQVDRLMIHRYGIDLPLMMENAGRALAELTRRLTFGGDAKGAPVLILGGSGGNGGGALVAARRLHGWGANVRVHLARPIEALAPVIARQARILRQIGLAMGKGVPAGESAPGTAILDGLVGYSLRGAPRTEMARMIRWAGEQPGDVIALDLPSGLDPTTGIPPGPAIRAAATLTLALPKVGLSCPAAAGHVGQLYLGDIGVPPELYREPTLDLHVGAIFSRGGIVRVVSSRDQIG